MSTEKKETYEVTDVIDSTDSPSERDEGEGGVDV
jgi:hypothetical protein